ncbi:MAG: hypothetical protein AAF677_17100 [Pseudomonadota bacterium]
MLDSPTLLSRLAVAKMAGLLIGLTGFLLLPLILPSAPDQARWAMLLWYPTVGAMIAMLDTLDKGEALPWRTPWWLRAMLIGGWMNFLAIMMGGPFMDEFVDALLGVDHPLSTSLLFVPEGAAAGLVIGYLVMRFAGDGRAISDD